MPRARFGWLTPQWQSQATRGSMFYVYLLVSIADPAQRYVGFTTELKQRLKAHNEGASVHTRKYNPWKLVSYFAFDDEHRRARVRVLPEIRVGTSVREQAAMAWFG